MITGIPVEPRRPEALALGQDPRVVAAVVLAGLVLAAGLSGLLGTRGATVLAALSLLWLVVNGPMEGTVLLTFSPGRGLTGADLAGFAGLALAGYRFVTLRRARVAR